MLVKPTIILTNIKKYVRKKSLQKKRGVSLFSLLKRISLLIIFFYFISQIFILTIKINLLKIIK